MGLTSAHTRDMLATPERRNQLRRLDDMLEALEQLNLHDITEVPDILLHRLADVGVREPGTLKVPQLIEAVWGLQQPYLIQLLVDRRRRRRRKDVDPSTPTAASKAS